MKVGIHCLMIAACYTPIHMIMGDMSFWEILQHSENDPRETIILLLSQVYK